MALNSSTGPTLWDHLYFWFKEMAIFIGLATIISTIFIAFFFLPEGHLTSEFLSSLFTKAS